MTHQLPQPGSRARYIMIGGFLGAGKTTLVGKLARHLDERGQRVGLITNDQSQGLVDSAILRGKGFDVEEIAGGCFCCRFHSLEDAVSNLTAASAPEVFLAEPVGSCTDLLATVSYPLRRIYGDRFHVAPLTVLVDPRRAARVLGLSDEKGFSKKVVYVYEKQLEEARLILVNKVDLLEDAERERLVAALQERFPRAEVLCVSARTGEGLEAFYARVMGDDEELGPTLDIDYTTYAEGEALLGWLNATVDVKSAAAFDANGLIAGLAGEIQQRLAAEEIEIAHLKLTLDAEAEGGQLAVISIVGSEREVDVRESLFDEATGGSLIINLRAEGDPERLAAAVESALESRTDLQLSMEHQEVFRPAEPVPVHRDPVLGTSSASDA